MVTTRSVGPAESPVAAAIPFEPAACCLCRVDDADVVAVGRDFDCETVDGPLRMVRCRQCGIMFLNPRPTLAALDRIYPDTYMSHEFLERANPLTRWAKGWVYRQRGRALGRLFPPGRPVRLFEVGCGEGAFSRVLQADVLPAGSELAGCELKADVAARARRNGIDVVPGRFEDVALPGDHYDLVLMLHVLEHLPEPRAALAKAHAVLRPGGMLVVETPNTASLDARIFRRRYWFDYQFPHWYLFDADTLARTLTAEGFEIARVVRQVGPMCWSNSIRNWVLDRPRLRVALPFFSRWNPLSLGLFTLVDLVLRRFCATSRFQVVARKTARPV